MNSASTFSFSEIIAQNRLLESVVERMDFPKSSWRSPIAEVCQKTSYSQDFALAVLRAFDENEKFPLELLLQFPIKAILNYLKATHRYYLEKKLPEIEQTFFNLLKDYRTSHPDLVRISSLFIDYKKELTAHIVDEETTLFPYIEQLIFHSEITHKDKAMYAEQSHYSLQHFEDSHEDVEKSLVHIRQLIYQYAPQNSVVMPFNVFLLQMDFFEKDLNCHGMMEDLVLMPLAQILELQYKK